MKHVIQKQEFLLTMPSGVDAFKLQHAASRYFRDRLLPLLERIFDELSVEGEVIRLDRCEIDIGAIPAAALESGGIDEALYRLMKAELQRVIEKELALHPAVRTGIRESVLAHWWYYMERGRLPWNAEELTEEDHRRVLELFSLDYTAITKLRKALREQPIFLMRVVAEHSVWFLENLLAVLTSSRQEGMGEAIVQAAGVHGLLEKRYYRLRNEIADRPATASVEAREGIVSSLTWWASRMRGFLQAAGAEKKAVLWRRLVFEAADRPAHFASVGGLAVLLEDIPKDRELIKALLVENSSGNSPFVQALRRQVGQARARRAKDVGKAGENKAISGKDGTEEARPPGDSERPDRVNEVTEEAKVLSREEETGFISPGTEEAEIVDHEVSAEERLSVVGGLREEEIRFDREAVDEAGIYVSCAGLILVHPFLSTFFHRLGLWDEAGFVDVAARQKAVLLLHFLATGVARPPEYELVFPKLLCGYALEMPMPGELELTEKECDEGLLLLENIVQRWEKLGSTSMEGLREGFLQRKGKLADKGGKLYLQVEASAIDVLLDYLPWGVNLVKLPWLKAILYVEWR